MYKNISHDCMPPKRTAYPHTHATGASIAGLETQLHASRSECSAAHAFANQVGVGGSNTQVFSTLFLQWCKKLTTDTNFAPDRPPGCVASRQHTPVSTHSHTTATMTRLRAFAASTIPQSTWCVMHGCSLLTVVYICIVILS